MNAASRIRRLWQRVANGQRKGSMVGQRWLLLLLLLMLMEMLLLLMKMLLLQ